MLVIERTAQTRPALFAGARRPTAFVILAMMVTAVDAGAQSRLAAPLRLSDALVGASSLYSVMPGDSLTSVGARFGVPSRTLALQNRLPQDARLRPGQMLRLDNRHVVPGGVDSTIIVNIPQRLVFLIDGVVGPVRVYPAAVGGPASPTPIGRFRVLTTRVSAARRGPTPLLNDSLDADPELAGEGPRCTGNTDGEHWIGLSLEGISIHDAIVPSDRDTAQTSGCVRLDRDHARDLIGRVMPATTGEIIYEPLLMAQVGDRVFLEVHEDVYRRRGDPLLTVRRIAEQCVIPDLDWTRVATVIRDRDGIAHDVTHGLSSKSRQAPRHD